MKVLGEFEGVIKLVNEKAIRLPMLLTRSVMTLLLIVKLYPRLMQLTKVVLKSEPMMSCIDATLCGNVADDILEMTRSVVDQS
jgi:hypothetical protein